MQRVGEHTERAVKAAEAGRVIWVSNHRSHVDYLVEPLVMIDAGIPPPLMAAGINLFGGPLGLLHRHVTGAIPIRRNTKDPAYLMTLKAYVAEVLMAQGWPRPELIAEPTRAHGLKGLVGGAGDPFFAVIATRPQGGQS